MSAALHTKPPNFHQSVVFYTHLRGLKLDGSAKLPFGRLIQDAMESGLAAAGLLSDLSKLPGWEILKTEMDRTLKELEEKNAALVLASDLTIDQKEKLLAVARQATADLAPLFAGRPMTVFNREDRFYGVLYVSDIAGALVIVEAELKRLGFLERSEIGHFDDASEVWRTYFPKNANRPFDRHSIDFFKAVGLL